MRPIFPFLAFSILVIFALGAAKTTPAQTVGESAETPKLEIFGGYSYLRSNIVVSGTPINLSGGSGVVTYNVNSWLGVVGDVGVYRQGGITANSLGLTVMTYQAGPRVTIRRANRLVPYGQVLLGGGHAGGALYTTSLGGGLPPIGASNAFVFTAGIGVDWRMSHSFGIRVIQAEYLYSQFLNGSHGNQQSNVRLSAGVIFNFGNH